MNLNIQENSDDRFNAFNFTSNFERAQHLFQEIESILESELADTPQIVGMCIIIIMRHTPLIHIFTLLITSKL